MWVGKNRREEMVGNKVHMTFFKREQKRGQVIFPYQSTSEGINKNIIFD
jgi:hypothetical protein